jgi:lipoprotein-anchoring transpeptidase ErfK/SrfK
VIKRSVLALVVFGAALVMSEPVAHASRPHGAKAQAVRAVVDLSEQRASFYGRNGVLLRSAPISSGAAQTPTPTGTFKVWKHRAETFSPADPAVRMLHMTNFYGSIGFHGIPFVREGGAVRPLYTPLGVYGISHGCIRMRNVDARWVFSHLPVGATVEVRE